MKRVVTPELLDRDAGSPAEIASSLNDLQRINRWFGGIGTTYQAIQRVAESTGQVRFDVLDVASASGDVPQKARERLRLSGLELNITLVDRAPSHLRNGSRKVA